MFKKCKFIIKSKNYQFTIGLKVEISIVLQKLPSLVEMEEELSLLTSLKLKIAIMENEIADIKIENKII